MKRIFLNLSACVLFLSLGCGGAQNEEQQDETTPETEEAPATEQEEEAAIIPEKSELPAATAEINAASASVGSMAEKPMEGAATVSSRPMAKTADAATKSTTDGASGSMTSGAAGGGGGTKMDRAPKTDAAGEGSAKEKDGMKSGGSN